MARRVGPKKVQRYSLEFKLKAVKLSQLKDVEVQAVANALEIHPFMLSRWRKEARDGVLDVTYQGGEMSLDHIHSNDIAIVCISGCQLRTRPLGGPWGDAGTRRPGETTVTAYAGQPTTHRHQNVGENLYRAISVENLRQTGWLEGPLPTGGTIKFVNQTRSFRVYDVKLMAGMDQTTHVHVFPTVAVLISGGATVRERTRAPKVLDHPGGWVIVPAGEPHTLSTGGRGEVYIVEIEVR